MVILFWLVMVFITTVIYGETIKTNFINRNNPFVVLDFNDRLMKNNFGREWGIINLNNDGAFGNIKFIKDEQNDQKGYVMQWDYNVTPLNAKVDLVLEFKGLDLSLFDFIQFRIKGDTLKGFTDIAKIEIHTWNQTLSYIIDGISPDWKTYNIHLGEFVGKDLDLFNWEGIERISLSLESVSINQKEGCLYLDDITLIPKEETEITLDDLKIQKYTKPRNRLFGFPDKLLKKIKWDQGDNALLKQIAYDTWLYFKNITDKNTLLVMDHIKVGQGLEDSHVGDYTNITNVGLYILCILSAYDLGFLKEEEAITLLRKLLVTLKKLKKWKGLFYNWYLTKNYKRSCEYISTVDNGWMAAGLITLRNSFDGKLKEQVNELLEQMDFSNLYDHSEEFGQFHLGYHTDLKAHSKYHYALIATEPRVASLIAIGKGDVPREHWYKLARTLKAEWDWQKQIPKGVWREKSGIRYFQGYYTYKHLKIVPSWGGSMFEFLMPTVVIDENTYSPLGFSINNRNAVEAQILYSRAKGYEFWGFSPCSTPDNVFGGYHEFGIPDIGTKGYFPEGVVTPHAIILALLSYDKEPVMDNLRKLLKKYPGIYGKYGFYDSIDIDTGLVNRKYLALDHAMILLTLNNYLNQGAIQKRFQKDPVFQNIKDLLMDEDFFAGSVKPMIKGSLLR
ncbi:MAG: DUF3131 domain-containing protein [Spirochaetes bacterium]|nr:DUF3131 domain-containing protein [Spirochaetota bacterium]